MKKRVTILLAFVGLFCLAVIIFPDSPTIKPSRLGKELPETFGDWTGRPEEPGEREKLVLAKDTEFERMQYHHGGGTRPSIQASEPLREYMMRRQPGRGRHNHQKIIKNYDFSALR